jgi:hypothetical protein
MARKTKIDIVITHADGEHEKLHVSYPIARIITERLMLWGWPYCSVSLPEDANDFISRQGDASNTFVTNKGNTVYL